VNSAKLEMKLVAPSGYECESTYNAVTPEQWGDVVRVLEGKLSSASPVDPAKPKLEQVLLDTALLINERPELKATFLEMWDAQPLQAPSINQMTTERAAYFMRRFKRDEKLLGPNEQAAVDYVIALLEQPSQAGELSKEAIAAGDAAWMTSDGVDSARVYWAIIAAINAKGSN